MADQIHPPRVHHAANPAIYAQLLAKAKAMRDVPTPAEHALWLRLRNNQLGVKFRRQHIIDRFIVDFYCVKTGLVIEVDGDIHDLQKEADQLRTVFLEQLGCTVIRFKNREVEENVDAVLDKIKIISISG